MDEIKYIFVGFYTHRMISKRPLIFQGMEISLNPLNVNVEVNVDYTPHDGDITCSDCGTLYRLNN